MSGFLAFCALALALYGFLKAPKPAALPAVSAGQLAWDGYWSAKVNGLEG